MSNMIFFSKELLLVHRPRFHVKFKGKNPRYRIYRFVIHSVRNVRTWQKMRTFTFGSGSAPKLDVLILKKGYTSIAGEFTAVGGRL